MFKARLNKDISLILNPDTPIARAGDILDLKRVSAYPSVDGPLSDRFFLVVSGPLSGGTVSANDVEILERIDPYVQS